MSNYDVHTRIQLDNGQLVKAVDQLKKTGKELKAVWKQNQATLNDMLAHQEKYSKQAIENQRALTKASEARHKAQKIAIQQSYQDLSMLRKSYEELDKMSLRQLKLAESEAKKKMQKLGGTTSTQKELTELSRHAVDIKNRIEVVEAGFKSLWDSATSGADMTMVEMEKLISLIDKQGSALAKTKEHYQNILQVGQKMREKLAGAKGFDMLESRLSNGKEASITDAQLNAYKKFYEGIANSANSSAKQVQEAQTKIDKAQEEISKRAKSAIKEGGETLLGKVNGGTFSGTIKETEEAIEALKLFKGTLDLDKSAVYNVDTAISKLRDSLAGLKKETIDKNLRVANTEMILRGPDASKATDAQIKEYKKFYEDIANSADSNSKTVEEANKKIAKAQEELSKRSAKALKEGGEELLNKVNGGTFDRTVDGIKQAIEQLGKFRGTLDTTGEGAKKITEVDIAVEKLKRDLEDLDFEKVERFNRIASTENYIYTGSGSATDAQLKEFIKYYQEIANSAKSSAFDVEEATVRIAEAQRFLTERERMSLGSKANTILGEGYEPKNLEEMKEAIDTLQKYRSIVDFTETAGAREIDSINEKLQILNDGLKEFDKENIDKLKRLDRVDDVLYGGASSSSVTNSQIKEYVKFYEEIASSAKSSAEEVIDATESINKAQEELTRRANEGLKEQSDRILSQVNSDNGFEGTIKDAKEAIETLQKFRETLDIKNVSGIKDVDSAIEKLKGNIAKVSENTSVAQAYLKDFFDDGKLPDTVDGLEKMKQSLLEYKKIVSKTEPEKLISIRKAITAIDKEQKRLNKDSIDWKEFMRNIDNKSLSELKSAYKDLEESIATLSPKQKEFNEQATKMREIDERIKELTRDTKDHVSTLENAIDRLKNYVLVYLSFNKALDLGKTAWDNIIELSDLMTNVQKVTGKTSDEIERLTDSIHNIDTRSSNKDLMELAESAGKLGINSNSAIVQFVESGQKITNTLGEIGGSESITELLKISELINKKDALSIEESLDKVGSAVLNIGNNSKASYAQVVEFTKRLGAVGAQSNLSMPQIMALGGTIGAVGGDIESASTALTRVLIGLQTNTKKVAQAVGVSFKELDELLQEGDTFGALQLVLNTLSTKGVEGVDNFLSAIGGKNSARAKEAISLLATNMDSLNRQLVLASTGYEDGSIATQEFEKANNNLAGTMAQISNEFYEITTSASSANGIFNTLAKAVLSIIRVFKQGKVVNTLLWVSLGALIARVIQFTVESRKALFSVQSLTAGFKKLWAVIRTNPYSIIITALTTIGTLIRAAKEEADAFSNSLQSITKEGEEELTKLTKLYEDLKNGTKDRTKAIIEFNQSFGSYLTNLIDEKTTVDQLAVAYNEAASAINNKIAAQIDEQKREKAREKYGEEVDSKAGRIATAIRDTAKRGDGSLSASLYQNSTVRAGEIAGFVQNVITKIVDSGKDVNIADVRKKVIERFKGNKNFTYSKTKQGSGGKKVLTETSITDDMLIMGAIERFAKAFAEQKVYESSMGVSSSAYRNQAKINEKDEFNGLWKLISGNNYGKDDVSKVNNLNKYLKLYKTYGSNSDNKNKAIDLLNSILHKGNPWGTTSANWNEMGGEDLATVIKWFNEVQKSFKTGKQFLETTGHKPPVGVTLPEGIENWDKDSLEKWAYLNWQKAIQVQKEKNDANPNGDFREPDKDRSKKESNDMDMALARLDEYYKRQEEIIENSLNSQEITEAEANRRLLANEAEHLLERQNLRNKFIDKTTQFTHNYITELMKGIEFGKIEEYLKGDGKKLVEGIRLNIAKDATKIQTDLRAYNKKIEDILIGENSFTKLFDKTKGELDILGLLMPGIGKDKDGKYQNLEGEIQSRMDFIFQNMADAVNMDKDELRRRLEGTGEEDSNILTWVLGLTDEQIEKLRKRMVNFNDVYRKELRKQANEIEKQLNERNAENGFDTRYADAEGMLNTRKNRYSMFETASQGQNWFGNNPADDTELQLYDLKIQKSKEYIEQIKLEMAARIASATTEEEQVRLREEQQYLIDKHNKDMADSLNARAEKQSELAYKQIERFRPYADMVNQFAEDFGGSIFGDKEDREKAAKALLTSFIKTTGQMLAQWLSYLAAKEMADKMATAGEIDREGSSTIASLIFNGAKGTGQEVGRLGWAGFAVGAAITAAITALVAMVTSKINESKSELGVSTGKLSTGMLTYADGRYPTYADGTVGGITKVDGADGQTYNATYKPNLTTGEYSRPHLGIVGEKGAELIVDHDTFMGLKRNAPHILQGIYDMHRYGRLSLDYPALSRSATLLNGSRVTVGRGVRTYADGNINDVIGGVISNGNGTDGASASTNDRLADVLERLMANGIQARINMYGKDELYESMQKANKFMRGK